MLLQLIGAAVLACFIAYQSTVVQKIKTLCGLGELQHPRQWKWWVMPIVLLWDELRELLNCPYCLSFWLGFVVALQYYTLGQAVFIAPLAIVFVELYRKLTL
jgi:hypothetical protein